jgi:hypothetical protein
VELLYRPKNKEELFNLRHASARNVIERIFGVLKRHFRILVHPPHYDMDVQARIPPALCAIHNFIRIHDPDELAEYAEDSVDEQPGTRISDQGELAHGPPNNQSRERASARRDQIAKAMWDSYQGYIRRGGNPMET